jgi:hypothetical protein
MATLRTATQTTVAPAVTTTNEVKLATTIRKKLLSYLQTYLDASQQMKELKATKEDAAKAIRKIRESTGASSIQLDGWTMTNVPGESFDRDATYKKLMKLCGLTIDQIKACEVYKPKKAFEKITAPGASGGDDE